MLEKPIQFLGSYEPLSSWSHFVAALYFFVASFFMIYHARGNALRITSLAIYCTSIVFLLSMSGTYHLLEFGTLARHVLQRLDHAGIWMLIIGTLTPFHVILFEGFWRWGVLLFVWAFGVTGLVLEVVFFESFPEWLSLTFYLAFGWVGLFSVYGYMKRHPKGNVHLIFWGGVCYSIGAILDASRWPILIPGVLTAHEIFHLFVIAGIAFHWKFIYSIADMGITKKLTVVLKMRNQDQNFAVARGERIRFFFSSKEDLRKKLWEHIQTVYRDYRCPLVIREKYVYEDFVNPSNHGFERSEIFYGKTRER